MLVRLVLWRMRITNSRDIQENHWYNIVGSELNLQSTFYRQMDGRFFQCHVQGRVINSGIFLAIFLAMLLNGLSVYEKL